MNKRNKSKKKKKMNNSEREIYQCWVTKGEEGYTTHDPNTEKALNK